MITSIVFITSLVLLFRYFKNSKSRIIIALLYSLFLIWYVQAVLNYGKYTLQPGQSIELRAHPNADQLGYSSELILKKNDDKKIKLTGIEVWSEKILEFTIMLRNSISLNLFMKMVKRLIKNYLIIKKIFTWRKMEL